MMPEPLHPAIVHLPIALAVLVPVFAILGIALIQTRVLPAKTWAAVVLLQLLLVASGWAAVETGEQEEERVEHVVAERHIETHEEAAERFLAIAALGLLILGTGLIPGSAGLAGRAIGTLATIGILAAGVSVGHSGGELVYRHGAANAHVDLTSAPPGPRLHHHDDDD